MEIVERKLDELELYERNSRYHGEAQVAQIIRSIEEFGFTNPILVNDNGRVIAGHGRLLAARELGLESVPTIALTGLTEAQERAYIIADNKLALNATWDDVMLKLEVADLEAMDFDMEIIGFEDVEFLSLFGDGQNDPNLEWKGMPEYDNEDQTAFRTIKIHFANQDDVDTFTKLLNRQITEKTKYLWYPEAEIGHVTDKRYSSES